jgi:hypothetical protein
MAKLNSGTRIYGNVTVDTYIVVGSNIAISGSTSSTSATTGALTVVGGVGIGGNLTISGNILTTANATANIGSTALQFNTVFAKATSAQYADLAEKYTSDALYEPGQVLVFGGTEEVTLSKWDMPANVAGVITTNPAYLMNSHLDGVTATVALQGRVPCFVTGPVVKGDMMVATINGRARAESNPLMGTVIGKALENFAGGQGTIEVAVGRI